MTAMVTLLVTSSIANHDISLAIVTGLQSRHQATSRRRGEQQQNTI